MTRTPTLTGAVTGRERTVTGLQPTLMGVSISPSVTWAPFHRQHARDMATPILRDGRYFQVTTLIDNLGEMMGAGSRNWYCMTGG